MCCSSGGQQEHPKFKVRHLHVQIACFYNAEEKRAKKKPKTTTTATCTTNNKLLNGRRT